MRLQCNVPDADKRVHNQVIRKGFSSQFNGIVRCFVDALAIKRKSQITLNRHIPRAWVLLVSMWLVSYVTCPRFGNKDEITDNHFTHPIFVSCKYGFVHDWLMCASVHDLRTTDAAVHFEIQFIDLKLVEYKQISEPNSIQMQFEFAKWTDSPTDHNHWEAVTSALESRWDLKEIWYKRSKTFTICKIEKFRLI